MLNTKSEYKVDLYNYILNDVKAGRSCWIWGSKGLGKTTLIKEIEKLYKDKKPYLFIEGRKFGSAKIELKKLIDTLDNFPLKILIDDCDKIINEQFMLDLSDTISNVKLNQKKLQIIATSRLSDFQMERSGDKNWFTLWSDMWQDFGFRSHRLNPWYNYNWKQNIKSKIEKLLGKINEDVIESWSDIIIELSGGSPFTLGPCIQILEQTFSQFYYDKTLVKIFEPNNINQNYYIEEFIKNRFNDSHFTKLLRIINELTENDKSFYDFLCRNFHIYDYNNPLPKIPEIEEKNFQKLKESGLVKKNNNSDNTEETFSFSGKLIYYAIRQYCIDTVFQEPQKIHERIINIATEKFGDNRGKLILTTENSKKEILLTKIQFSFIKILDKFSPDAVPFAKFQKDLNLTRAGVISVKNRLSKIFKDEKAIGLIKNARNFGYKLGEKPRFLKNASEKIDQVK